MAIRKSPDPSRYPGLDPHGQLAGEWGDTMKASTVSGRKRTPAASGPIAQVVLDVEGEVQEQGEDRRAARVNADSETPPWPVA